MHSQDCKAVCAVSVVLPFGLHGPPALLSLLSMDITLMDTQVLFEFLLEAGMKKVHGVPLAMPFCIARVICLLYHPQKDTVPPNGPFQISLSSQAHHCTLSAQVLG